MQKVPNAHERARRAGVEIEEKSDRYVLKGRKGTVIFYPDSNTYHQKGFRKKNGGFGAALREASGRGREIF